MEQKFDINRFKMPAKIEWVRDLGYRLTNGDTRIFDTYSQAYNATRN